MERMDACAHPIEDLQLFDFSQFKNLLMLEDEGGGISGIVKETIDATRANLRELSKAVSARSQDGIIQAAHKLVSGSGYLGMVRTRALVTRMENAAKCGDIEAAVGHLESVKLAFAGGYAALEDAMANRPVNTEA
jgi:HPt (histidine-containing phosphotransfer) domain-containing protein